MNVLLQELLGQMTPILMDAVGVMLLAVMGYVAAKVRQYTGVKIDDKHLRTLHSAIMTAAEGLIGGVVRGDMTLAQAVDRVEAYVLASVPDAVARLVTSNVVLRNLIQSKLRKLIQDKMGIDYKV